MTRINVVPVTELTDKHLLAEYRELPRIFGASKKWFERGGRVRDLPQHYRLGRGHVRFFYNKLLYCYSRQRRLYDECKRRGFNVNYEPSKDLFEWAPGYLQSNYLPTRAALRINRERIAQRLEEAEQRRLAKR